MSAAAVDHYASAKQKFGQIESDKLKAGTRLTLTPNEIEAWVAREAPSGVRNPKLELQPGVALDRYPGAAELGALIDARRRKAHAA